MPVGDALIDCEQSEQIFFAPDGETPGVGICVNTKGTPCVVADAVLVVRHDPLTEAESVTVLPLTN